MRVGYELKNKPGGDRGVFATRRFERDDIVLPGVIERKLKTNSRTATQIGMHAFAVHAGMTKLVNHSCEPNCGVRVNKNDGHDIVAMRVIEADEEILLDYAMQSFELPFFPDECGCGALRCRGRVTGWRDLPIGVRASYAGYVAPYLLEM